MPMQPNMILPMPSGLSRESELRVGRLSYQRVRGVFEGINKLKDIKSLPLFKKKSLNMKSSNLTKIAGAGILSLSLTLLPSTLPASAQTTPNNVETEQTSIPAETNPVRRQVWIDGSNANLLGAIGIICLALLSREYSKPR